ncbi:hypothetical protein EK21DRAFT_106783 [Setomelanomma holmii]|uniref:Uncharacterized protein n=1 Tax=Setomelanomma holmii TaxID=210430 RepID=A0A9P4HN01_9PLEO|nr:hypothetical protein EK21DRAFT_106783 [Setomelanomma holmii]
MEDVGITQFQFNVGQQLLSLGIVIFEIPLMMILYKESGLHYSSFCSGSSVLFKPGKEILKLPCDSISSRYDGKWTAKRTMIFFFGNQLGQASTNLIAYVILHMKGVAGYPGWFWLFVIMGSFTIASGIFMGFCLPDSIENLRNLSLPKFKLSTDRELHILRSRVTLDGSQKSGRKQHIKSEIAVVRGRHSQIATNAAERYIVFIRRTCLPRSNKSS